MSSSKGKSNIQSKVMARKVVSEFSLCNFFVRTGLLLIKLLVLFVLQWLSVWSIAGTSTKAQTGVSPICTCTFAATRFWQKAIKLIFLLPKGLQSPEPRWHLLFSQGNLILQVVRKLKMCDWQCIRCRQYREWRQRRSCNAQILLSVFFFNPILVILSIRQRSFLYLRPWINFNWLFRKLSCWALLLIQKLFLAPVVIRKQDRNLSNDALGWTALQFELLD